VARNTITVLAGIELVGCSGSGPTYTASYDSTMGIEVLQVGDWSTAVHHTAGDPNEILSTYTYQVIAMNVDETTYELTLKYITDSDSLGDASPCDLNSGAGSSGSPEDATQTFTRDLGPAFLMFMG